MEGRVDTNTIISHYTVKNYDYIYNKGAKRGLSIIFKGGLINYLKWVEVILRKTKKGWYNDNGRKGTVTTELNSILLEQEINI